MKGALLLDTPAHFVLSSRLSAMDAAHSLLNPSDIRVLNLFTFLLGCANAVNKAGTLICLGLFYFFMAKSNPANQRIST